MKHYIPFITVIGAGLGVCLWRTLHSNHCLFTFQDHCYTCNEYEPYFVGLPENCTICANKQTKYYDWEGKSIWACLNAQSSEDKEIFYTESINNIPCPKDYPLRDILGHCYSCNTIEPVQIQDSKNICQGKRYLTRYRNSEKSNFCPPINQIQNPYICLACQGQWQNEKCVKFSLNSALFCQKNSDCPPNQWCYPCYYPVRSQIGICRPLKTQKWICSDMEGYTYDSAKNFCARQNAILPSFEDLENEAEEALSACPQTNIWVIFDEGNLYLDSLKTPFPITKEKESIELGGDNTYALCLQN